MWQLCVTLNLLLLRVLLTTPRFQARTGHKRRPFLAIQAEPQSLHPSSGAGIRVVGEQRKGHRKLELNDRGWGIRDIGGGRNTAIRGAPSSTIVLLQQNHAMAALYADTRQNRGGIHHPGRNTKWLERRFLGSGLGELRVNCPTPLLLVQSSTPRRPLRGHRLPSINATRGAGPLSCWPPVRATRESS